MNSRRWFEVSWVRSCAFACALDDRPVLNVNREGRGAARFADRRTAVVSVFLAPTFAERRTSSGRLSIGSVQERSLMTGDEHSIRPVPGKVPEGRNSMTTCRAGRVAPAMISSAGVPVKIGCCPGCALRLRAVLARGLTLRLDRRAGSMPASHARQVREVPRRDDRQDRV